VVEWGQKHPYPFICIRKENQNNCVSYHVNNRISLLIYTGKIFHLMPNRDANSIHSIVAFCLGCKVIESKCCYIFFDWFYNSIVWGNNYDLKPNLLITKSSGRVVQELPCKVWNSSYEQKLSFWKRTVNSQVWLACLCHWQTSGTQEKDCYLVHVMHICK
jgi:hypothetical protein